MVNMRAVSFTQWRDVLEEDPELSPVLRNSYGITIRWFLGHCKRTHRPADFEQARSFIEEAQAQKQPSDWVLRRWKDAVNWFFRNAPKDGDLRNEGGDCRRLEAGELRPERGGDRRAGGG